MLANAPNIPPPVIWQPPASGEHTGGLLSGGSTTAYPFAQDILYATPLIFPVGFTASGINLRIDAAHAGDGIVGLYNDDGSGYPGTQLGVTAAITWATAFHPTAFAGGNVDVTPGIHWLVLNLQTTGPTFETITYFSGIPLLALIQTGTSFASRSMWSKAQVYDGTLPASFPSGGALYSAAAVGPPQLLVTVA